MSTPTFEPTSTVAVRGSAQLDVEPDYARLHLSIRVSKSNRETAMAKASRMLEALHRGFAAVDGIRAARFPSVRVHRVRHWDETRAAYVDGDWMAGVHGYADVDAAAVAAIVTTAVGAGADVSGVSWYLDRDNTAYREVRKLAVEDAHRAARDFADALGVQLGALVNLADPGLLGPVQHDRFDGAEPLMSAMSMRADDSSMAEIDLDPEPQSVFAQVEGSYRLTA